MGKFGKHGPKINFRNQTFRDGGFCTKIFIVYEKTPCQADPNLSVSIKKGIFLKEMCIILVTRLDTFTLRLGHPKHDLVEVPSVILRRLLKKHVGQKTKNKFWGLCTGTTTTQIKRALDVKRGAVVCRSRK